MEPRELVKNHEGNGGDDSGGAPEAAGTAGGGRGSSQATRLVQLSERAGLTVFHDERGEGWARLPVGDRQEHWPCRSKPIKRWLARLLWKFDGAAANSDAVTAAVNVLEGQARFDGVEIALHNRVAVIDDNYWYDLSNPEWEAVRVNERGWSVEPNPPVVFRRYAHQRPQVRPVPGGDLHRALDFVNLRHPQDRILFLVYIVSCFVPGFPHPVPVVHGGQGSAKTSLLRVARRLVDPSLTETLTAPRDIHELVQQLSHHWFAYYDNLSSMPDWLSEALCRAVTGEGFSKRELYSDDEDVIYYFRRCCGLNGINIVAAKPDLFDRSLLFGLERIHPSRRRPEKAFWASFERVRPQLVGAALDTLQNAIRILPTVVLPELPRMADFALWGCAIAVALGHSQQEFLDALDANFQRRNEEVITSDVVAVVVTAFVERHPDWEGSASDLLGEFEQLAPACRVSVKAQSWPKAGNALSRRLNVLASNLAATGIEITRQERTGHERMIRLRKVTINAEAGKLAGPVVDGGDSRDDRISPDRHISSSEKGAESQRNDDRGDKGGISAASEGSPGIGPTGTVIRRDSKNIAPIAPIVISAKARLFSSDDPRDDVAAGMVAGRRPAPPPVPSCTECGSVVFWKSAHGETLCQHCGQVVVSASSVGSSSSANTSVDGDA